MPAVSQKQQEFMAIDYKRAKEGKKTKTGMTKAQLKEYASTKRKGLPVRVKKGKK